MEFIIICSSFSLFNLKYSTKNLYKMVNLFISLKEKEFSSYLFFIKLFAEMTIFIAKFRIESDSIFVIFSFILYLLIISF